MPLRKADPRYRGSAFFKAHGVTGTMSRQTCSYTAHGHAQTLQILRQKALKLLGTHGVPKCLGVDLRQCARRSAP